MATTTASVAPKASQAVPKSATTPPVAEAATRLSSSPRTLPRAYLDPSGYLHSPSFHKSTTFTPTSCTSETHAVSYAVVGSLLPSSPVLIWLNGLGGHRLAGLLLDGICAEKGIRLLALDRPSSGTSTPVAVSHRVQTSHEALLAVLDHERITTFSLLSHSNGVIYAIYTLLNLPAHLTVKSWTLSSPFVPPSLSGSVPLSLARYVPPSLTVRFGGLVAGLQKLEVPLSWSSGAARDLGGWSSGIMVEGMSAVIRASEGEGGERRPPPAKDSPEAQYERFVRTNAQRAPHRRLHAGRSHPAGLFSMGMAVAIEEGLGAMGQEALVTLRVGDGKYWGWGEEEGGDERGLYERGFTELKHVLAERGYAVELSVWYGKDDGMIPSKGREYLRGLLVDRLQLVEAERWTEMEGVGHDEGLQLEVMMDMLLERVIRAHRL
ncbi:hypothetical protein JCM21900_004409 [Sporobolomyces salmonicolor]